MGSDRLRVAMVLDWHFYYLAPIANALAEVCDVLVVTRDHGHEFGMEGSAVDHRRQMLAPQVRMVVVNGSQSNPFTLGSALAAGREVRGFCPDVVHFQSHVDWRLLRAAQGAGRVPWLYTMHDVQPHPGADSGYNRLQLRVRKTLRSGATGFIVHGEELRRQLEASGLPAGRPVFVIPHGPVAQPSRPTPLPERPKVLFFGRMQEYKGVDHLIDAARIIRGEVPDLRVVLAGTGGEAERLKRLTVADPTFEWIDRFIPDDEIPDLFQDCLFVALPYIEASQSGVVPLAFSNGRTVVATRVGALAEAVEDGRTGLMCPPADAPALAEAMGRLIRDRSLLETLTRNALAEVQTGKMSPGHIARMHLAAYRAAMERVR